MRVGIGSCVVRPPEAPVRLCGVALPAAPVTPESGSPSGSHAAARGRQAEAAAADARDPLLAALVDALLGAAGLGDFRSFTAEEPAEGAGGRARRDESEASGGSADGEAGTSEAVLARAVRRVERENYQVVNADVSLRRGEPPGHETTGRVADRLAAALHVAPAAVSVKWSAGGALPGGELRALAVVLLDQIGDIDALHASIRGG